ncbi:MAG: hypothetical protein DMG13_09675 [Acidobacteria bacterium]|nr:MAG: hypothetical protein DMG13_09675 [Acidobacteriota bacterium]
MNVVRALTNDEHGFSGANVFPARRPVEGMDVVGKIAAVPTENERPVDRIDVYSMKAERKR